MHIRRAMAVATCGALSLVALSVPAQPRDPAAATELFSQGRDAIKDGDPERACPLFAASNRLDPKVGTLLNLGDCEEQRRHFAEAQQAWQEAINLAEATNDPRREIAAGRLERLAPRVPRLTIRIGKDSPPGTRVYRDDVEIGEVLLGRPLPVDPGDHRIVAVGPDKVRRTFHVRLGEGETTEIAVTARAVNGSSSAAPAGPSKDAAPKTSKASGRRTLAYVLGGVGIAGVATGIVTGAMLMSRKKTVDDHCSADGFCDPQGIDAADSGKTLVPINSVAWAVGAVGLGAGAYFLFTSTPASPASTGSAAQSRCTGAVLQVSGAF